MLPRLSVFYFLYINVFVNEIKRLNDQTYVQDDRLTTKRYFERRIHKKINMAIIKRMLLLVLTLSV